MKLSFSHLPSIKYGSRPRPTRDWLLLLGVFALLLLGSLAWNLWLFTQVTSGNKIGTATTTSPVHIELEEVQTLFSKRATEQTNYIQQYHFVDPSL